MPPATRHVPIAVGFFRPVQVRSTVSRRERHYLVGLGHPLQVQPALRPSARPFVVGDRDVRVLIRKRAYKRLFALLLEQAGTEDEPPWERDKKTKLDKDSIKYIY